MSKLSRFESDSDLSDTEKHATEESLPMSDEIKPNSFSINPSRFLDTEAILSDGEGGDAYSDNETKMAIDNNKDVNSESEDDIDDNDSLKNFVAGEDEIEFDSESYDSEAEFEFRESSVEMDNDMQSNPNSKPGQIDSDAEVRIIEKSASKQRSKPLSDQLAKKSEKKSRYFIEKQMQSDPIVISDSESDDNDSSETDDDNDTKLNSQSNVDNSANKSNDTKPEMTEKEMSELVNKEIIQLSDVEFERLVSKTAVELAVRLEAKQSKAIQFDNQTDEIALKPTMNMIELFSYIDDSSINGINKTNKSDIIDKSVNILRSTTPRNDRFLRNNARLDNTVLSANKDSNNDSLMAELNRNEFVNEEFKLANETLKKALTKKKNLEQRMVAPPLSMRDARVRRKKRDSAGKQWFKMPRGKLTTANKLHFLMAKYRHLLYRDFKPAKLREQNLPQYFQMGTVIEGPSEYYSNRITRRNRHKNWASQFLKDRTTRDWLAEKTRRALKRSRRPGKQFWAAHKKFQFGTRYSKRRHFLKTKIQKSRNQRKKSEKNARHKRKY